MILTASERDQLKRLLAAGTAVDSLPLHWTLETMLWNWGHPRFHLVPLPKRAAWLNLIAGFWKILQDPTPAGARRMRLHEHAGGRPRPTGRHR